MNLLETSIFLLNNDLVRLTKIMNKLVKDLKILSFKVIFQCLKLVEPSKQKFCDEYLIETNLVVWCPTWSKKSWTDPNSPVPLYIHSKINNHNLKDEIIIQLEAFKRLEAIRFLSVTPSYKFTTDVSFKQSYPNVVQHNPNNRLQQLIRTYLYTLTISNCSYHRNVRDHSYIT